MKEQTMVALLAQRLRGYDNSTPYPEMAKDILEFLIANGMTAPQYTKTLHMECADGKLYAYDRIFTEWEASDES